MAGLVTILQSEPRSHLKLRGRRLCDVKLPSDVRSYAAKVGEVLMGGDARICPICFRRLHTAQRYAIQERAHKE